MNLVSILVRGLVIGFSVAAPVGPIGMLCIQRTLAKGFRSGFLSGVGDSTALALFGIVAATGVTAIAAGNQMLFRVIGGLLLLYLGIRTFFTKPSYPADAKPSGGEAGDFLSAFLLAVSSPATVIWFAAVFASFGTGGSGLPYVPFALGVFLGSTVWWLLLCGSTAWLRQKITPASIKLINGFSGVVFLIFAALAFLPLANRFG